MSRLVVLYLGSLMFRSLCVGVLALAATMCFRSVAKRHAIWVAALLIMVLMPVADAILPVSLVPAPVQRIAATPAPAIDLFANTARSNFPSTRSAPSSAATTANEIDWWTLALFLYGLATLALLGHVAWAYRALLKLKAAGRRVTMPALGDASARDVPCVYESDSVRVPLAGGFKRPFVLLPAGWRTWDAWKLQAVLAHELTHIRRRDCAITAIAVVHASVFWFNPLVWWLKRQLTSLAEKASDEASVLLTGDPARYAEVLLQFVADAQGGRRLRIGGVSMATQNMRSRIERVLTMQHPDNGIVNRASWAVVLIAAMPVLYAAAAMHIAPETPAVLQPPPPALLAALPPTSGAPMQPNLVFEPRPGTGGEPQPQADDLSFASWLDRMASMIRAEERDAYEQLQTDEQRQHFIEQFWARRHDRWLDEDVAYISTEEERITYLRLQTDEERQHFIEQFWARRDPSPATAENEFRIEHYRRIAHADQVFRGASEPGWKTDRGRTYIVYGQPDNIQYFLAGGLHIYSRGAEAVPYGFQHWVYRRIRNTGDIQGDANDVIFDFADSTGRGEYRLVPQDVRPIDSGGPQSNVIDDLVIRGNHRFSSETIGFNLQAKRGAELSLPLIRKDIQTLDALGYFDEIRVDVTGSVNGGKIVSFDVREKP